MATIQSTLALSDKMSPAFSAITKAMNSTLGAISSIKGANLGPEFAQAASDIKMAEMAVGDFNRELNELRDNPAPNHLKNGFTEFNSVLQIARQGIQLVKAGINELGEMTTLYEMQKQAETSLAVVLANQGAAYSDYQNILAKAGDLSLSTTLDKSSVTAAMGEIATYISDPAALEKIMPSFADFAIGMNNTNPEMTQTAAVQYATALGKALQGQYDGLTKKGFIVSEEQKEIIANGTEMERVAVVADIVSESWGGLAETIAQTELGTMVQMENETNALKAAIGEGLYPYMLEFQMLLANAVTPALEFVAENLDSIIPIAYGVGGAFGVLTVAFTAHALATQAATAGTVAYNIVLMLQSVAMGMAALATGNAALMQHAWNTALLASPIGWVALAIGVIIFLIYKWVQSVGGIEIAWIMACDTIYNATSHLKEGALMLLQGMLNGAIGMLNDFIGVINQIPGVNIGFIAGATFGAEAKIAEEAGRQARRVESEARIAEILAGKEAAAGNTMEDLFNGVTTSAGGTTALNVKNAEPIKIDGEDIKMLLDISTMRYQLNYSQITPQVSLSVDTIRETADVDRILETMTDWVAEASESRLVYG